jgi:hypothetical protein
MAVALASPRASRVSGQVFGASGYNISLFSQPRPIASLRKEGGWTPEGVIKEAFSAWEPQFLPLTRMAPPQPQPAASS